MQREDLEGTQPPSPWESRGRMWRARSRGHHNPIPTGEQREDVEETTTLIPVGNQREDLEGTETSIPREEQREDLRTTTSIPTGKLVPGIRGAEALPGRY